MKPFTKVVSITGDGASAVTLTDSFGLAIKSNWIECIPLETGVAGSRWLVTVSGLSSATYAVSAAVDSTYPFNANGQVGITIPMGTHEGAGASKVLDLHPYFVSEVGVQLLGDEGGSKQIAFNYGVNIPTGQAFKYHLTPQGD